MKKYKQTSAGFMYFAPKKDALYRFSRIRKRGNLKNEESNTGNKDRHDTDL
jgi:hypothetical protein